MRSRYAALILLVVPSLASAHPLSFGLLELRDESPSRVRVTWRFSGTETSTAGAEPSLPSWCREVTPRASESLPEGIAHRVTLDCGARGLVGADIAVRGLERTGVQVIVRHVSAHGIDEAILDDDHRTWTIPGTTSRLRTAARYLALGVEHIATGWDHLSFVAAIALVARSRRRLLATITAFTLGHSITLALAALGLAHAPQRAVECAIAWSIVVVAREALHREDHPDDTRGAPWAVAALFGLLHGFGFAGALGEVGIPRDAVLTSLVGFNLGVELGQVLFVTAGLALAALLARTRTPAPLARKVVAYATGTAGACWCIERAAAMVAS